MTERMIPVPESLLKRVLQLRGMNYQPAQDVLNDVRGLLLEPTLTKEQVQRLILDASAKQLAAEEAAEKPMCGDVLTTKMYKHECVEDKGHTGPHRSFSGLWWHR